MENLELPNSYMSKIITLSMNHISHPTNSFISDIVQEEKKVTNIGLKVCYAFDYGYIMHITDEWDKDETPDDLRDCIVYALQNECRWINFSYHVDPIPVLDTYDPDEGTDLGDLIINGKIVSLKIKCYEVENMDDLDEDEWVPYEDIDD